MKIIQNEFAKELSKLFVKYNKTIQSDKAGIYITAYPNGTTFFIGVGETASEDYRDKLIIALNSDLPPSEEKKEIKPSIEGEKEEIYTGICEIGGFCSFKNNGTVPQWNCTTLYSIW